MPPETQSRSAATTGFACRRAGERARRAAHRRAGSADHFSFGPHGDAALARRRHAGDCRRAGSTAPAIVHAGFLQREQAVIGGVVVGEQQRAAARHHAEPRRVQPGRTGQHHAGPVVAGESDETLMRASRQHHAAGADGPVALARRVRWRLAADDRRHAPPRRRCCRRSNRTPCCAAAASPPAWRPARRGICSRHSSCGRSASSPPPSRKSCSHRITRAPAAPATRAAASPAAPLPTTRTSQWACIDS